MGGFLNMGPLSFPVYSMDGKLFYSTCFVVRLFFLAAMQACVCSGEC